MLGMDQTLDPRSSFTLNTQTLLQICLIGATLTPLCTSHVNLELSTSISAGCPNLVSCPKSPPAEVNTCCLNHPSGHFLLTQFWDSSPPVGPDDAWTIHGLWPDYCSGGFDAYCDKTRSHGPEEISRIISNASHPDGTHPGLMGFLIQYWLSSDFRNSNLWSHEWNKHGTCISTLEPKCYSSSESPSTATASISNRAVLDYFTHAVYLYSSLDTYAALSAHGIFPSHHRTYSLSDLEEAISATQHGFPATFRCHGNQVNEIWYHFNVRGDLRNALDTWQNHYGPNFVPTAADGQKSNCPAHGIRYLPKREHRPSPSHTTTATHAPPTSTGGPSPTTIPTDPFSGKGRLRVHIVSISTQGTSSYFGLHHQRDRSSGKVTGQETHLSGCLIRSGEWYNTHSGSSCAVYTASDDVVDPGKERLFTLSSSRAPCAFVSSEFHRREQARSANECSTSSLTFTCARNLPVQGIFSAKAGRHEDDDGVDHRPVASNAMADVDDVKLVSRATPALPETSLLAYKNRTTFYAEHVPRGWTHVPIWAEEEDEDGTPRPVKLEIHWETLS